ncbi:MAG: hypothetical protein OXF93_22190 [Acidobacteria bacterium]|nr:hypothetical protein [Acidobacteriota bacterium]
MTSVIAAEAARAALRALPEGTHHGDHPAPLERMVVPCRFEEIAERWQTSRVVDRLVEEADEDEVKLPPRRIDRGADGVREALESLGIFFRMRDGRVNIPDVFRVGYGLGRKGGVKPIR